MTVVFWLILAAMTVLAALFVLWPLWRSRAHSVVSRRATNVQIYREQVAQMHAQVSAGTLDQEMADARIDALGRRLLIETQDAQPAIEQAASVNRRPWWISGAWVVLLPLVAFAIYLSGNSWKMTGGTDAVKLDYMASKLEHRTQARPGDVQAWRLLASVREAQGQYQQAATAYGHMNQVLQPPNAAWFVRQAEALVRAAKGQVTRKAQVVLQRALKLNPDFGPALWFAGVFADQQGDIATARAYWQRLAQQPLPPAFKELVNKRLDALPEK